MEKVTIKVMGRDMADNAVSQCSRHGQHQPSRTPTIPLKQWYELTSMNDCATIMEARKHIIKATFQKKQDGFKKNMQQFGRNAFWAASTPRISYVLAT